MPEFFLFVRQERCIYTLSKEACGAGDEDALVLEVPSDPAAFLHGGNHLLCCELSVSTHCMWREREIDAAGRKETVFVWERREEAGSKKDGLALGSCDTKKRLRNVIFIHKLNEGGRWG